MRTIHETATLTSKGQLTLPKPIRQALGVDTGGKILFSLRGGDVIVTRADAEHEDPAIGAFLDLLEADADLHGQLLLRQAQQATATTQPAAQMEIDVGGHGPNSLFGGLSRNGTARPDRRKRRAAFASGAKRA